MQMNNIFYFKSCIKSIMILIKDVFYYFFNIIFLKIKLYKTNNNYFKNIAIYMHYCFLN